MRGKQFAWIFTDFQMSVIKIVIIILIMIINIIISHYHNIKIKYERQSGNCAGYLKRYTSVICSIINQMFFYSRPLLLICYRNWIGKKTHAGHAAFEKKWRGSGIFQIFFRQDGWHCFRSFQEHASYQVGDAPFKKFA